MNEEFEVTSEEGCNELLDAIMLHYEHDMILQAETVNEAIAEAGAFIHFYELNGYKVLDAIIETKRTFFTRQLYYVLALTLQRGLEFC